MPLKAYAVLISEHSYLGHYAKCYSMACKDLHAACCMTPMLLARMQQTACHTPQIYFYETTKIATGCITSLQSLN